MELNDAKIENKSKDLHFSIHTQQLIKWNRNHRIPQLDDFIAHMITYNSM